MAVRFKNTTEGVAVLDESGSFHGAILTAGSDAATLILYDNASTSSGTVIAKLASPAANTTIVWTPAEAMGVSNGIYAAVTGTSPSATICYKP